MSDTDARLQDIEHKISYQELLLENLNEALTDQQRQLNALSQQISQLHQLVKAPHAQIKRPEEETPPPHY